MLVSIPAISLPQTATIGRRRSITTSLRRLISADLARLVTRCDRMSARLARCNAITVSLEYQIIVVSCQFGVKNDVTMMSQ
jgi:hypothetical protein